MKDDKLRVLVHRRTPEGKLSSEFYRAHPTSSVWREAKMLRRTNPYKVYNLLLDHVSELQVLPDSTKQWHAVIKDNTHGPIYKLDVVLDLGVDAKVVATRHIHYLIE